MKLFYMKCFNVFQFEFKIFLKEKDHEKTWFLELEKTQDVSDVSFLSYDDDFNKSYLEF